jgi:hypothetical protein
MSESYIGPAPKSGFISTAIQRVTGSTNNYVDLDHSISSLSECIVWLNNVKQDTNSLTLTTSTRITLGGTLVSGDVVQILFVAKAVSTQAPATGQVTLDMLSASGTKNNTTFLRGDNTFATASTDLTAIADGSAGSPSIANSGDTDTGIYWGTANELNFASGGVERGTITAHTDGNGGMMKLGSGGNSGMLTTDGGQMQLWTPGSEEMHIKMTDSETTTARFKNGGGLLVNTNTDDGNSLTGGGDYGAIINCRPTKTPGFAFQSDGLVINRSEGDNNNRDMVMFYRNGSNAGNISASNSSVTYGTFLGVHYAQLTDDSKPDILVGTVMESINETSEWHMAQFTVPEYTEDGVTYPSQVLKRYIPKTNSVGDNIKFKWHKNYKEGDEGFNDNAIEYDAVVIKENDEEYLTKVKVSDTEDSKAVYGVFESWMESEANDISVGSLGAFMIRVHKDETVSIGDYLQSKGDGTAKVQADDILRASTIAKVVKTNKIKTYDDGSYLVSCTLHCG